MIYIQLVLWWHSGGIDSLRVSSSEARLEDSSRLINGRDQSGGHRLWFELQRDGPRLIYLTKHATHERIDFEFQPRYVERTGVRHSAAQQPYDHALFIGIDEGDDEDDLLLFWRNGKSQIWKIPRLQNQQSENSFSSGLIRNQLSNSFSSLIFFSI